MSAAEERSKAAILALLSEARVAGLNGLTRTSLVKYLYLLDVFVAEELGGYTWTGANWIFHHFGPYSSALETQLDSLEKYSFLEKDERYSGGKEFVVYQAARRADIKPLSALGLPAPVVSKLTQVIREYAYSLSKLLDYVYFRTAPMTHARPGDQLDFGTCKRVNYREDVKQLVLKPLPAEEAERARRLVRIIKEQQLHPRTSAKPMAIYDDAYARSLAVDDQTDISDEMRAALEFPSREDGQR